MCLPSSVQSTWNTAGTWGFIQAKKLEYFSERLYRVVVSTELVCFLQRREPAAFSREVALCNSSGLKQE